MSQIGFMSRTGSLSCGLEKSRRPFGLDTHATRASFVRDMGWGTGVGKKEVLNPAAGDVVICGNSDEHPFHGKLVLIDVSGLGHRASKHGAAEVVRMGTSAQQQDYVRKQIASVAAEGGYPVLVLDGRGYPPKLDTRSTRREKAEAARQEAEAAARLGKTKEAADAWKRAAGPQEPFWHALLEECLRNEVLFIVSPYEADAQLVSLANELGERAIIWAAANDSDLVAFGGTDVIYDWDPFVRSYRRVRLLDDILGKVVGDRSFVGWTYDRFLIFTILSGNDYFKNLPDHALSRVYTAMAAAALPAHLIASDPHPPLDERPAAWFAHESLMAYAAPVVDAVARKQCWTSGQRRDAVLCLIAAYHAVRQHPVAKLRSLGPDALQHANLEVGVMEPLSQREMPASTLASLIPGIEVEASADEATAWARGRLRLVGGVLQERLLCVPRDPGAHDASADEDFSDEEARDTGGVALDGSSVTLDNVAMCTAPILRAFLVERGLDFYSNTSLRILRALAAQLLQPGAPVALDPAHPALHRHSRPNRHLTLLSSNILRGADVYDLAQYLRQSGLIFDEQTRDAWLPFENTRARGRRLYDSEGTFRSGHVRAGSRSHAHSTTIIAQPAIYAPPGKPAEEAYIFRMAVHASMRQIDHIAMLAVTKGGILLAPNSCCSCEVGIECSHLFCLLIVLHVMQQSSSYNDFRSRVLVYDKLRAPSGQAVWWPDVFVFGLGGGTATADSKLPFDQKVFNVGDFDVRTAASTSSPAGSHQHNSADFTDYHHSSRHVELLRRLCQRFRTGQVAQLVGAEYGTAVAPLATVSEWQPEPPGAEGSDPGSNWGSQAGSDVDPAEPTSDVASCSEASAPPSPLRPGPQLAGYGSPQQSPVEASSPIEAPSQGRSKRVRGRTTPASQRTPAAGTPASRQTPVSRRLVL